MSAMVFNFGCNRRYLGFFAGIEAATGPLELIGTGNLDLIGTGTLDLI